MIYTAPLPLTHLKITRIPDIDADVVGPHSNIHRGILNSDSWGEVLLTDGLADHKVEKGGFSNFAVANENDFMRRRVPLKHRFRWDVVIELGKMV